MFRRLVFSIQILCISADTDYQSDTIISFAGSHREHPCFEAKVLTTAPKHWPLVQSKFCCMHVDRPMLGSNRVPFLKKKQKTKKKHDDKSDQCIDNSSTRQLPIQHFWHVGGNSGTTLKQTCMSTQQTIVRSAEMIEVMATCCTVGRR